LSKPKPRTALGPIRIYKISLPIESLDATLGRVAKGSRGQGLRAEVAEQIGTDTESLSILEVRERRLRLAELG